ncbi:MAG TPA: hypothetical protein VFJ02_11220 [Vicinamibacterales bacterium]|nr:hypothetical protein [Vicinamibacterales bacterium]
MKILKVRSCVAAALVLTVAGTATAQERPAGLLNSVEVRQLAARAEAADNVRLGVHFTALADLYAADARRHITMSESYAGNARGSIGSGMTAHCKRLADLNTQAAAAARDLASYHEKLAGGIAATAPRDGARFLGGAGAPDPTVQELKTLAAEANTPAQHRALEEYFRMLAKRYASDADEHTALAQAYRGTRLSQAAVHHDRLAALARDEAKEATGAAAMHKSLAGAR